MFIKRHNWIFIVIWEHKHILIKLRNSLNFHIISVSPLLFPFQGWYYIPEFSFTPQLGLIGIFLENLRFSNQDIIFLAAISSSSDPTHRRTVSSDDHITRHSGNHPLDHRTIQRRNTGYLRHPWHWQRRQTSVGRREGTGRG